VSVLAINALSYPEGMALDNINNQVLVGDRNLSAVLAVQLDTGERVFLSK